MRLLALIIISAAFVIGSQAQTGESSVREITLHECVELALESNLDIQIQRLNPQIANFDFKGSYGAYDPQFSASANFRDSTTSGGTDEQGRPFPGNQSEDSTFAAGFNGVIPTGMTYSLNTSVGYNDQVRVGTPSDSYAANLGVRLTQPLLKNFWIDGARLSIRLSKNRLAISEHAFTFQVMQTIAAVERSYYNLVASIEGVKVQEKALELGERTLAENRKRVEVGTMAPLDVQEAEAQVATSKAEALNAQRLLDFSENSLKNLITDDYVQWQNLTLVPKADLIAKPADLDVRDSWNKGLTMRPDLIQTRINLESQDIQLKYDHNQLFPSLDVFGSYSLAGFDRSSTDIFGNTTDASYGAMRDQVLDRDSPTFGFGVQLQIPLTRRAEKNRYRASQEQKAQLVLQLKQQEQAIMVNIDNAVKLARTNFERVQATAQARQFAEAALDAEQKKLASGKSTTFVVLRLQRDLTDRRASEIGALADYYLSLTDLSLLEGSILDDNEVQVEIEYY